MMNKGYEHTRSLHMFCKLVLALTLALFLWSAFTGDMVWGFDQTFYFQAAILLAVLMCGKRCHYMGHGGSDGAMKCEHPMGCHCGDCNRCK